MFIWEKQLAGEWLSMIKMVQVLDYHRPFSVKGINEIQLNDLVDVNCESLSGLYVAYGNH